MSFVWYSFELNTYINSYVNVSIKFLTDETIKILQVGTYKILDLLVISFGQFAYKSIVKSG